MNDEGAPDPIADDISPGSAAATAPGQGAARGPEPVAPAGLGSCRRCGAQLTAGQLALPLLGTPKFGIRLGPLSVEADVGAALCIECGLIELWVPDMTRIHKAIRADRQVNERMQKRPGR